MQTKNSISKLRRFAYFFVGVLMLSPIAAFAQSKILDAGGTGGTIRDKTGLGSRDVDSIVGSLVDVFVGLLGLICVVLIIYAGFIWMTAQGETDKIDKAKKTMGNAAIGLVIVMSSYGITQFLGDAGNSATGTAFTFGTVGSTLGTRTPEQVVASVATTILGILSLVAVILIIAGGVMWMTSGGDETKVEKAQKLIRSSFIGLAIVLTALSITNYITQTLVTVTGATPL